MGGWVRAEEGSLQHPVGQTAFGVLALNFSLRQKGFGALVRNTGAVFLARTRCARGAEHVHAHVCMHSSHFSMPPPPFRPPFKVEEALEADSCSVGCPSPSSAFKLTIFWSCAMGAAMSRGSWISLSLLQHKGFVRHTCAVCGWRSVGAGGTREEEEG